MPRSRRGSRIDAGLARDWPLPVDPGADKHGRGTILVVGGARETPGAVILAGIAALRMGAGRLQIATADGPATAVAIAVPEALVLPLAPDDDSGFTADAAAEAADHASRADAVVVGPGMRATDATTFVQTVVTAVKEECVVVLDALALKSVPSLDREVLERVRGRLVLTPNRQEVERLGCRDLDELAQSTGAVVTSFGEIVAPDGRRWTCADSTPGLGTSGSGDVLAGLIGGAAARSGDAAQAAVWGSYAHVEAGRRLSERMGAVSFISRELLDEVPRLMRDLGC